MYWFVLIVLGLVQAHLHKLMFCSNMCYSYCTFAAKAFDKTGKQSSKVRLIRFFSTPKDFKITQTRTKNKMIFTLQPQSFVQSKVNFTSCQKKLEMRDCSKQPSFHLWVCVCRWGGNSRSINTVTRIIRATTLTTIKTENNTNVQKTLPGRGKTSFLCIWREKKGGYIRLWDMRSITDISGGRG